MSRHLDRLARLEQRARTATFDPRAACLAALEAYNSGEELPATFDRRERALALAYTDALRRSENIFAPEDIPS